ncbi:MAG: glycosyl hydrolase family 28-related protein, partial [Mycobacteriaceae bacterium]
MPIRIDRNEAKPHIQRGANGSSATLRPMQGRGPTGPAGPTGPQGLPGPGSAAWTAAQAVTVGSVRQATDGSWIKSTANRTTGSTFDTTEQGFWTPVLATAGTMEQASLSTAFAAKNNGAINVKDAPYNAVGNGIADDTAAIQAALDAVSPALGRMTVIIPSGTYMIDAVNEAQVGTRNQWIGGGIKPKAGTTLLLAPDAILKVIPNASPGYACVYLDRYANHVTIRGGQILGDRATHDYTTDTSSPSHEFGYGVALRGCTAPVIEDMTFTGLTGDGVFAGSEGLIGDAGGYWPTVRGVVRNCVLDGARRNNISIVACDGFLVEFCTITNAGLNDGIHDGTAPRYGIDIEGYGVGGTDYQTPLKVVIRHNRILGNSAGAIMNFNGYQAVIENNFTNGTISYGYGTESIIRGNIVANLTDTTHVGISSNSGGSYKANALVSGNIVLGFNVGIQISDEGASVVGNYVQGFVSVGIEVFSATSASVTSNTVMDGSGASAVGIRANQSTYVHIGSNTVRNTRTAYRAIGTSTGINFIGNVATKGYIGFDIATSSQVVIKGNTTNLPGHAAGQSYDVTYANTCDVLLEDNIFRNSSTYSVNAASGGTGGKSRILGNKIIDSTSATVIVAAGGQHAIERNTVISTRPSGTGQPAIIVNGSADGSFVIGNIVSHEGATAFSKMLDSSAGTHTSVMGNYFDGATIVTSNATDYVGNNFQLGVTPPAAGGTSGDPGGQIIRTGFSVGVTGSSTTAMTANTMLMRPVRIQKGGTLTGLAVNVTTAAASSSIRVGIYAHNATTGLPGSLIQEFTSTTTLDSTTT